MTNPNETFLATLAPIAALANAMKTTLPAVKRGATQDYLRISTFHFRCDGNTDQDIALLVQGEPTSNHVARRADRLKAQLLEAGRDAIDKLHALFAPWQPNLSMHTIDRGELTISLQIEELTLAKGTYDQWRHMVDPVYTILGREAPKARFLLDNHGTPSDGEGQIFARTQLLSATSLPHAIMISRLSETKAGALQNNDIHRCATHAAVRLQDPEPLADAPRTLAPDVAERLTDLWDSFFETAAPSALPLDASVTLDLANGVVAPPKFTLMKGALLHPEDVAQWVESQRIRIAPLEEMLRVLAHDLSLVSARLEAFNLASDMPTIRYGYRGQNVKLPTLLAHLTRETGGPARQYFNLFETSLRPVLAPDATMAAAERRGSSLPVEATYLAHPYRKTEVTAAMREAEERLAAIFD